VKTYLEEHQAEAFGKIAEAMGKDDVSLYNPDEHGWTQCGVGSRGFDGFYWFNPLTNAEQWVECLFWFRRTKLKSCDNAGDFIGESIIFTNATESRESLLFAILEYIGGEL